MAGAVLRQIHARGGLSATEVEAVAANFGDPQPAAAVAAGLVGKAVWVGSGATGLLCAVEEVELYAAPATATAADLSRAARIFYRQHQPRLAARAPAAISGAGPRPIADADVRPDGTVRGALIGRTLILDEAQSATHPLPRAALRARWAAVLAARDT